ncbi:MAG: hypothetical protein JWR01_2733 [Subtercola sp.]|nr:hypothetical protein [Subtercola sp.]
MSKIQESSVGVDPGGSQKTVRRRVFVSSVLGSVIENYDFLIYATASSLVFNHVFFPQLTPAVGIIASLGTLAAGYIARPLGGIIFGQMGDRIGRKSTLILTMILMSCATVAVGFLPGYSVLGIWAPILLVVLRLIQGIAVGGEWGGSVLMTTEHSTQARRGFFGSATNMGASIGNLLGFVTFGFLSAVTGDAFLEWGWRIPFIATAVLLLLGLYMRLKVQESPLMAAAKAEPARRLPILTVIRNHPKVLLLTIGMIAGPFTVQAVVNSTGVAVATGTLGMNRNDVINAVIIALVFSGIGIPLFAMLSDKVGRRPVYAAGAGGFVIFSFFVFPLINTANWWLLLFVFVMVLGVLFSATHGTTGAILSEVYPTSIRYSGVSTSFQFAAMIGGGLGPVIAASLLFSGPMGIVLVSGFLVVMTAISFVCILLLGETGKRDLRAIDTEGATV